MRILYIHTCVYTCVYKVIRKKSIFCNKPQYNPLFFINLQCFFKAQKSNKKLIKK